MNTSKKRKRSSAENGGMKMIDVKDLTFSYGKDKQALHGLNFSVGDGGMVSLFGKDIRSAYTQEFFQKIGVLFEFPYLYANLSALDNLHYFASFYPKEQLRDAEELLDELEFKRDYLKKPVSSYSKGMRQRVSMARALISNPKLLFLDEPTSGLDPAGAVLFRKLIERERQKGTTVFLTTHNMLDADLLCDRVAFISNGKIVALDTPGNLKEQNSNHSIIIHYLYQGKREEQTVEAPELKAGIPFVYDEIISVHSQEPTLEDIFIRYTGRRLS